MAFNLTKSARLKSAEGSKEPQLVIEIEGVPTVYGSTQLLEYILIGDVGLFIDGTWKIGGLRAIENQESLLGFGSDAGTTTKITQSLDPEKGRGSSVQTMTIGLIDKDQKITQLISPGEVVEDIMGRRARVYLGFDGTAFKRDFIPVFKGIIDDLSAGPGTVRLQLGSAEQKKRQDIFQKAQAKLNGSINNSQTTITVDTTDNFIIAGTKPDGSAETILKSYVRIDDEIIQFTGKTATTFTGCVRGSLGTVADSHDDEATVDSFYRLGPENGVDLALKIMLGGWQGPFATGVEPTNFVYITPTESVANCIWFEGVDVEETYGLTPGDYVTSNGAINGANNFTAQTISSITVTDTGSYIVMNGVSLVQEFDTTATLSFRSQYDTLPAGAALKMLPDDVDVYQHQYLKTLFLLNYTLDIYVEDSVNGKEFIETEIYLPASAYSVPRKARSSMQVASGPLPGTGTVTLDETTVLNPTKINIRRSIGKNFYNNVVYKYDQEPIDQKFLSSTVTVANDSLTRIPVGPRSLVIESKGLRSENSAVQQIERFTTRRLSRYKYAAEFIENLQVAYGVGFNIEVGDIVILDGVELKISDSANSKRGLEPRLFEVINKTIDVKSGQVSLNLLDTAYTVQSRYGLIAPSSLIKAGISTTQFVIEPLGIYSRYGNDEGAKWSRFKRPVVKIRNADHTGIEFGIISHIAGNTITLLSPLTFTPSAGQIMELADYNEATEQTKLLYGFMNDNATFDDGKSQYLML